MPPFTCDKALPHSKPSEGPFMTKHMHKATSSQSSPFLSVHTSPYIDSVSRLHTKTPTTPDRNGVTRSISPCFSTISDTKTFYSAIEVTGIYLPEGVSSTVTELECATPDSDISMESGRKITKETETGDMAGLQPSIMQDDLATHQQFHPRHSKERPSFSRGSSISRRERRSTSQSTANRSASSNRRSSKQKPRRIPTDHSQTSTGSPYRSSYSAMSRQKHQDLLSLHQNSCRLFQSLEHAQSGNEYVRAPLKRADSNRQEITRHQGDRGQSHRSSCPTTSSHIRSYSTPAKDYTNSTTTNSQAHSSLLNSYGIYLPAHLQPGSEIERESYSNGAGSTSESSADSQYHHDEKPASIYKPIPPTVIEWTSPSTRKREYEKIDRSYRGIRGFWRRFAPQFCQPGDRRTPFFDEGKCGNGVYGGSVRRFRMDFHDDHDEDVNEEKISTCAKDGDSGTHPKHNGDTTSRPGELRERQKWNCFKFKR